MANFCFQAKAYWNFLLTSKTKYRIHSPFVYGLVTQCLERPSGFKKMSAQDQLLRIKDYHFKHPSQKSQVMHAHFIEALEDFHVISNLIENSSQESIFLIHSPHASPTKEKLWERLTSNPQLNVSIDLFSVGILYKRPHQVKEHFSIRLL